LNVGVAEPLEHLVRLRIVVLDGQRVGWVGEAPRLCAGLERVGGGADDYRGGDEQLTEKVRGRRDYDETLYKN